MAIVTIDGSGSKNLDEVVKLKFVVAVNPPINEKVVVDDGSSVSSISGINTIRATVGNGDGNTGWVKVIEIPPADPSIKEVFVQLSKATSATLIDGASPFAVLKRNGAMLGQVDPPGLAKVKIQFGL